MKSNDDEGLSAALPLAGYRVLEVGRVLAGPFAGLMLEDLGAEVVKAENMVDGDSTRSPAPFFNGQSHYFLCVNRGKLGVSIDARSQSGADLIAGLISHSDILIHNFRPNLARNAGLDPEMLSTLRPEIISCAITGFGSTGSKAEDPAYDLVLQATTGMLDVTGRQGDDPVKAGVPVADLFTGLYAVIGMLAALRRRQKDGIGAHLDVSLFDVTLSLLTPLAEVYLASGDELASRGAQSNTIAPHGIYPTADGLVAIACSTDDEWVALCNALDLNELRSDERFVSKQGRRQHCDALDEGLSTRLALRRTDEWTERLTTNAVCWAPVCDVGKFLSGPDVRRSGVVQPLIYADGASVDIVASPFAFSQPEGQPLRNSFRPAPTLGGDTMSVLHDVLGISIEEIDDLVRRGVVMTGPSQTQRETT